MVDEVFKKCNDRKKLRRSSNGSQNHKRKFRVRGFAVENTCSRRFLGDVVSAVQNARADYSATRRKKQGSIKIGKVNIDEEQELAVKFEVDSIPTIYVFKDGKVANHSVGLQPLEELERLLD